MLKQKTLSQTSSPYENRYFWLALFVFAALIIAEPAHAQAWAEKTKSIADDIAKGLKSLAYTVGALTVIWSVIQIWLGNKRLQDMVHWFIGAALLIAIPELLNLIPK